MAEQTFLTSSPVCEISNAGAPPHTPWTNIAIAQKGELANANEVSERASAKTQNRRCRQALLLRGRRSRPEGSPSGSSSSPLPLPPPAGMG